MSLINNKEECDFMSMYAWWVDVKNASHGKRQLEAVQVNLRFKVRTLNRDFFILVLFF